METKTAEPCRLHHTELENACRFLRSPFPDCFCLNISSFNIRKMLAYCTGDYGSCPIYCREVEDSRCQPEPGQDVNPSIACKRS
jgi:hypothetical protein